MPRYDYRCRACQEHFTMERSISEPEGTVHCPKCQSSDAVRDYSGVVFGGKAGAGSCGHGNCGSCSSGCCH